MRRVLWVPLTVAVACTLFAGTQASAGTVVAPDPGGHFSISVRSFKELRFHRVVRQQYDFSCGSAALATLLAYHYDRPSIEQTIFQAMFETGDQDRIRRQGFSMLDMKRYVEGKGYRANGYRVTLKDIERVKQPGIALITLQGYRHFVVVKGINASHVLVGDPALGLRAVEREVFEAGWNGLLFAIDSEERLARDGFNRPQEWALLPPPPVESAAAHISLANFALSLPEPRDF